MLVMTNKEFKNQLCELMQKDGHCNGIQCKDCNHMMQIFLTALKLKLSALTE